MMGIGDVIERERKRRGISAKDLARRSGLSRDGLYSIEAGECSPTVRSLQRIGGALGVEAWRLLQGME